MHQPGIEEYNGRIRELQRQLTANNIPAALILHYINLIYYTGTFGPDCLFVPAEGTPLYFSRRRSELPEFPWPTVAYKKWSDVPEYLSGKGINPLASIGLEFNVLPVTLFKRVEKAFAGVKFVDVTGIIMEQRSIKTAFELDVLRKTAQLDLEVWNRIPELIAKSATDIELTARIEYEARSRGHFGLHRVHNFNLELPASLVTCGVAAAECNLYEVPLSGRGLRDIYPQGAWGGTLEPGIAITVDYGANYYGYTLDQTRTFAIERIPDRLNEAFQVVLAIQEHAVKTIKPGITCGEVFDGVYNIAKKAGLEEGFMGGAPFLGHGIGLEIDEFPPIAVGSKVSIKENMALAMEPKIIVPGVGAVGLENDFIVTKTGLERLTTYTDQLQVIMRSER